MYAVTAKDRFTKLDANRTNFIDRCESYAKVTIPRICTEDEYDQNMDELTYDYQSTGAIAVNHLANKMILSLFAPSRPFFRIEVEEKVKNELLGQTGLSEQQLGEELAKSERKAIRVLEKRSIRPKLLEGVLHLIITGNVLLVLEKEMVRIMPIKSYVVKRDSAGNILEIITREKLEFSQLEEEVQKELEENSSTHKGLYKEDSYCEREVCLYKWIKFRGKQSTLTQWVDDFKLPEAYSGKWPSEECPYRAITWSLSDGADYGTGHVENFANDLHQLSILSQAQSEAAIQASQFRWLCDPEGMTSVQDLQNTRNGDAIAGKQGDISIVVPETAISLQYLPPMIQQLMRNIGTGFLMNTAVTRDAERVTAEEIRAQINELETGLGGAYTRIAQDLQLPLSRWLLKEIGVKIGNNTIQPVIVTGLDALSRNGDLENFAMWIRDMGQIETLPPELLGRLKLDNIASHLASARGIKSSDFVMSQAEYQQRKEEAMATQQQQAQMGVPAGAMAQPPM
jgi:hypothetical protein